MDRTLWEKGIRIGQGESPFLYILWTHLVGDVNQGALRVDVQHHTLYGSHVMLLCAKIGEKRDDRFPHPALFTPLESHAACPV
jgi:hypothetical protein